LFDFRQWNKTSDQLNSHVVASKSRKQAAAAPSSSAQSPSIFGRLTKMFSGPPPPESGASGVEEKRTVDKSKRNYGFATKNLMLHSDKSSEDLYRYKNFSSDHMRSSSPTREEDEAADASATGAFAIENRDSDKDDDKDEKSSKDSKHRYEKKK
jgi:hypothetical protein